MRTKSILLGAAVLAAGVASSFAQSNVYSVNVVGYINVTCAPGFNMLANQLDVDGIDTVGTVLNNAAAPATIDGFQLLKFKNNNYTIDAYDGTGQTVNFVGWYDNNTLLPSTNTIAPGTGFFVYNPYSTNIVLTMAGSVEQGTNSVGLPIGFSLISTIAPQAAGLDQTATNNFPATDGMEFLQFTNTIGHPPGYTTVVAFDASEQVLNSPGWYDTVTLNQVFPAPGVGTGYFIYNFGPVQTWTRTFNVQ